VVGDGPDGRAAVVLEPAQAHHLAPMIAEAYGLTEREQAVTELVARGLSTGQIASRLYLSAYTVQDHLKSIFDKVGVRTRGEIVARVFFDHYAPRLAQAASPEHIAGKAHAAKCAPWPPGN
jgi:DNA-binding NarL/FixJ family response regulator